MRILCHAYFVASLIALAGPASAAGSVNVAFVDAARFSDAGTTRWEEAANLKALAEHLQSLGTRFLRDGEVLKVEVLDVDLAGTARPTRRSGTEVRILKGGADWPRIALRYSLEANGAAVRSAQESLSDLNYLRGLPDAHRSENLHYEKSMLEKWFKANFGPGRAAAD
jgi:Protein of unknown function (DUF3016)